MGSSGHERSNQRVRHSKRPCPPLRYRSPLGRGCWRLVESWALLLACTGFSDAFAQAQKGVDLARAHGGGQAQDLPFYALAEPPRGNLPAGGGSAAFQRPTYLRDVLPIIMRRCSRCHNVQARFVYNWLEYRTAYADRFEIARRVWDSWKGTYFKESMPIANSPEALAITPDERATIRDWALEGGLRGTAPPPVLHQSRDEKIAVGRQLFTSICAACHQPTGRGIPNVFPPLASSDFLNADKNRAIKTVLNGRQGEIIVNGQRFNNSMPKFPLNDQDIADVLTYVYNSFGNSGVEVSTEEVARLRAEPPDVENPQPTPTPQPKSEFE